jgi:hypothetical protein
MVLSRAQLLLFFVIPPYSVAFVRAFVARHPKVLGAVPVQRLEADLRNEAESNVVGAAIASRSEEDVGGPYNSFQSMIMERIDEADSCSNMDGLSPPVITFSELSSLALQGDNHNTQQRREQFVHSVQDSGGYFLVELGEAEADILAGMWEQLEEIYRVCDDDATCTAQGFDLELRHQMLTRQTDTSENNSGYQFITTFIDEGDFLVDPPTVVDVLGMDNTMYLLGAYRLLEKIGRGASVLFAEASMGMKKASNLVKFMLDSGETEGSGHRLCRYVATSEGNVNAEGLATHTDWSLVTPVPVSSIAGLEVFVPKDQSWVRPELEARKIAEEKGNDSQRWYSRYVVVMLGKWMEVMTNGSIRTCVHRVVPGGVQQRLSCPFFMRPREKLFVDIRKRYDTKEGEVRQKLLNLIGEKALECMHDFLMEEYSMQKSLGAQQSRPQTTTNANARRRPRF